MWQSSEESQRILDQIQGSIWHYWKVIVFDRHLRKAGGLNGWNIMVIRNVKLHIPMDQLKGLIFREGYWIFVVCVFNIRIMRQYYQQCLATFTVTCSSHATHFHETYIFPENFLSTVFSSLCFCSKLVVLNLFFFCPCLPPHARQ